MLTRRVVVPAGGMITRLDANGNREIVRETSAQVKALQAGTFTMNQIPSLNSPQSTLSSQQQPAIQQQQEAPQLSAPQQSIQSQIPQSQAPVIPSPTLGKKSDIPVPTSTPMPVIPKNKPSNLTSSHNPSVSAYTDYPSRSSNIKSSTINGQYKSFGEIPKPSNSLSPIVISLIVLVSVTLMIIICLFVHKFSRTKRTSNEVDDDQSPEYSKKIPERTLFNPDYEMHPISTVESIKSHAQASAKPSFVTSNPSNYSKNLNYSDYFTKNNVYPFSIASSNVSYTNSRLTSNSNLMYASSYLSSNSAYTDDDHPSISSEISYYSGF